MAVRPVLQVKSAIEALVGAFGIQEPAGSDSAVHHRIAALRQSYTMERERKVHDVVARTLQEGGTVGSALESVQADGRDGAGLPEAPAATVSAAADTPCAAAVADDPAGPGAGALGDNVELF
jgi:hypothetical protein